MIEATRIAHIKVLHSRQDAESLRARMLAHLAGETHPELCDIRIVRGMHDINGRMPRFVTAFLEHRFARG